MLSKNWTEFVVLVCTVAALLLLSEFLLESGDQVQDQTIWVTMSMCFNQKPPKDKYNFQTATLLSAYLWLRLTPARVIVTIAYEPSITKQEDLDSFTNKLISIGAIPKLFVADPNSVCDCVAQSRWLRILAYNHPDMGEDDLMVISDSDVFITTSNIIKPLTGNFRAWVYWVEPALYGGQTFGISLTTLRKKDWRFILLNCSTCESVIETFSDVAHLTTMGDWTDVYGKHWESEQNVVTSQLLRLGLCSVPKTNRLAKMFMQNYNMSDNLDDSKTCYKGQGYGECRSWNLGNTWYEEVGGCPWYHHWYPLELLQAIVKHNQEEDFMRMFQDHFMHDDRLERMFFDHRKPYI